MEKSYWSQFILFVKKSCSEKFKTFMPGCVMGFLGGQHLLFSSVAVSVVTYCAKYVGTVFMAFGSGLATSYAAHVIDRLKEKRAARQKPKE